MCHNQDLFINMQPYTYTVKTASRVDAIINEMSTVRLVINIEGEQHILNLHDVQYSPTTPINIISISSVTSKEYTTSITSNSFKFIRQKNNELFIEEKNIDKLWILK
jgi:hypothetical protein